MFMSLGKRRCIRHWLYIYGRAAEYVWDIQFTPRNMHTFFALLCFVVVIHWLIFPYPSGLLHWHCGNLTIAPVPVKQPWWIWINTSCEFIINDCITTTKQSTTKPCAYFLGYTVRAWSVWRKEQCDICFRQVLASVIILSAIYNRTYDMLIPFKSYICCKTQYYYIYMIYIYIHLRTIFSGKLNEYN